MKSKLLLAAALMLLLAACGSPTTGVTPTGDVTVRTMVPTSVSEPTTETAAAGMPTATKGALPIGPSAVTSATPVPAPTTAAVTPSPSPTAAPTAAPTSTSTAATIPTAGTTPSPKRETATAVPRAAERPVDVPDFEMVAYQGADVLGGREARFSDVFTQGKPVVLNFWAGNCPPCRLEMPSFQKIADEYEGRVIFVGLDVGVFTGLGDHKSGRQLLDELGIRYPSAYATDASPLREYRVLNMPTTIFLDSNGKVVSRRGGIITEDDLRGLVEQLVSGS